MVICTCLPIIQAILSFFLFFFLSSLSLCPRGKLNREPLNSIIMKLPTWNFCSEVCRRHLAPATHFAPVRAVGMLGFAVTDELLVVLGSGPSIRLALLHFERMSWPLQSWSSLLMGGQFGWRKEYHVGEAAAVFVVVLAVVDVAAAASVVAVAAAAAAGTAAVHQGLASYMVFEGQ